MSAVDRGRPTGPRRYLFCCWCLLENGLFAGLVFGWSLFVIILKEEGMFSQLCHTPEHGPNVTTQNTTSSHRVPHCAEQDQQLNLVFTVATLVRSAMSPLNGQVLYRWGVRVTRIYMGLILSAGMLLVAFSSREIPWLLFPGTTLMAIGGDAMLSSNMQAAYLFHTGSSLVASSLTGMFNISGSAFLLIEWLYERGVTVKTSFLALTGLFVILTTTNTVFLSPSTFFVTANPAAETRRVVPVSPDPQTSGPGLEECFPSQEGGVPSLKECVLSRVFLSHTLWFCVLQLRWLFYVGAFNMWITEVTGGVDSQVKFYTDMNLYIQIVGLSVSILTGVIMDFVRRKYSGMSVAKQHLQSSAWFLAGTSVLAVLVSGLILQPMPDLLVLIFVTAITMRALLFGTAAAVIQMMFPVQYFGSLFGVLILVGGVTGCCQYPLFTWAEIPPVGVIKAHQVLLALVLVSLIHPVYVWIVGRRAERAG